MNDYTMPQPRQQAELHAPHTNDEYLNAARQLIACGFTANTVAQVLHADIRAVRTLLAEESHGRR